MTHAGTAALQDKVAIVTGAAGGLGRATVAVLEAQGAKVVAVDLHGDGCLHLDLARPDSNRRMVEAALDRHGRLDVLVLNAGVQYMAPVAEFPDEEWERLMAVMAAGPFWAIKAAWPALTARPGGRIVATASGSSFIAEKFKAGYVAAKHALLGLIRVVALEGVDHGLTANAVAPGWMDTPMMRRQMPDQVRLHAVPEKEIIDGFMQRQPGGRPVEVAEVAHTIAFLASTLAGGINGACVPVDRGLLVS